MNKIIREAPRLSMLLAMVAIPTTVVAEPIRVTGGYLLMTGLSGTIELVGEQGFSLSSRVDVVGGIFNPWQQCSVPECTPGTLVDLKALWSGRDLTGSLSFQGETYPLNSTMGGAGASVEFAGSFIAPALAPSAVVTAPFLLIPPSPTRNGSGFTLPLPIGGVHTLFGGGTTTVNLSPYGPLYPNAWHIDSVRYDFSATEPVPEPGTILLVGLGMAGAVRRFRRGRLNA